MKGKVILHSGRDKGKGFLVQKEVDKAEENMVWGWSEQRDKQIGRMSSPEST